MRAFYANGVDKMYVPWAVEGLPMLLHLALFLFFGGLAIYLFNVDQKVFKCVVSWIGFFSVVYGLISLLPVIRADSPYNTPFSTPLRYLLIVILFAVSIIVAFIVLIFVILFFIIILVSSLNSNIRDTIRKQHRAFQLMEFDRNVWMFGSQKKKAEEKAEKQSSEIDGRILGWTISSLGDDDSLEKFFEAMPGFFVSDLVGDPRKHLPYDLLRNALVGFLGLTLSSKSITHSAKLRRLDLFTNTIKLIGEDSIGVSSVLETFLFKPWDLAPQTIEVAHALDHWTTSNDQRTALYARCTVTLVLAKVPERDGRWVELAARISGLPDGDIRNISQSRDNLLLATLIDISRQNDAEWWLVRGFTQFDIRDTLPRLQHDFCALWNGFVDGARVLRDPQSTPVRVLTWIRPLYVALHQGTDAAPAAFAAANDFEFVKSHPSSYPLCNIVGHRLKGFINRPHFQFYIDTSSAIRINNLPADADASTPVPTPGPPVLPPPPSMPSVQNASGADATSAFNAVVPQPVSSDVDFSTPASSLPSRDPLFPHAESLALLSNTTPSHPTSNATLPRVQILGLVNTGTMCFANAVLQLLVHTPPMWDLFRELGDLKGRRRAGGLETDGGATPLVDATVRFFGEFISKEEPLQPAATGEPSECEEVKMAYNALDSFEPKYMYDAMKKKRRLKDLLVRSRAT
jgi:hypothetical protein